MNKMQKHLFMLLACVLLYAVEVIPATKSDISMLNHVIDRAMFKIFRCDDVKYVRSVVDPPCVSSYISDIDFVTFDGSLLIAFHGQSL